MFNNGEYELHRDGDIYTILSNFDTDYIYSVIKDKIENNRNSMKFTNIDNNNIIRGIEDYFKSLMVSYNNPDNLEYIKDKRIDFYQKIIKLLSESFDFYVDYDNITDYYTITYYLYDFFITNLNPQNNISKLFTQLIIREKNTLYDMINTPDTKKEKKNSYSKKIYKNNKLALIANSLEEVLNILYGYDIKPSYIVEVCFDYNQHIINIFNSCISLNDNIYRDYFIINNNIQSSILQLQIKTNIQSEYNNSKLNMEYILNNN